MEEDERRDNGASIDSQIGGLDRRGAKSKRSVDESGCDGESVGPQLAPGQLCACDDQLVSFIP